MTKEEKLAKIREDLNALTTKIDFLIDEAQAAMPEGVSLHVESHLFDKDSNKYGWAGKHVAISSIIDLGKFS